MKWYFQTSPHDTHDWDSTQTPVIADLPFNGRTRKLVMTATRNGYFFVLDRTTGEHLVTSKLGLTNVWASGPRREGTAEAQSEQGRARSPGALVNGSVLNYPPPTFSPDTGTLLRQREQRSVGELPDGAGSARIDGPRRHERRRRRLARHDDRRGRLQDRQDRLAQEDQRRQSRAALDGRRRALREQRSERRGLGRGNRARCSGIRRSADCRARPRRSCSTASSTCSSRATDRSTCSC